MRCILLIVLSTVNLHVSKATGEDRCPKPFEWLYSGVCYYFSTIGDRMNWFSAVENCRRIGAILATPHTVLEANALDEYIKEKMHIDVWLGGTDLGHEGEWIWESTSASITNVESWVHGQPDNKEGLEHCMMIRGDTVDHGWVDEPCKKIAGFICQRTSDICDDSPQKSFTVTATDSFKDTDLIEEFDAEWIPPITLRSRLENCCPPKYVRLITGSCYFFSRNLKTTWTTAKDYCQLLGGMLAEPREAEENFALKEYAINFDDQIHWLGGKKYDDKVWVWESNAESIKKTFWFAGEPNNQGGQEKCLATQRIKTRNYKWNDRTCEYISGFICSQKIN